jgi:hypothetical protein
MLIHHPGPKPIDVDKLVPGCHPVWLRGTRDGLLCSLQQKICRRHYPHLGHRRRRVVAIEEMDHYVVGARPDSVAEGQQFTLIR